MLLQAIVVLAIPAFLVAMGVEHLLARRRGLPGYRLDDALASVGCGIAQQISLVFLSGLLVGGYDVLHRHVQLVTFSPGSPWPWLIGFVAADLVFYGWHRASHEIGLLWASHVVHHQSEEYNLSVALRQAVASSINSAPFYYPVALLGVPTATYEVLIATSALYQFWLHTRLVGKLGPLERVLNTPSNHRVHHAVNPRYIDRNYGGVLVIWDRLFGTYAEEREEVFFGVTHRLRSFNPLRAQIDGWLGLVERARSLRGLDRLRVLWRSPGFGSCGPGPTEEELLARPPLAAGASRAVRSYVLAQFVPLTLGTLLLLLRQASWTVPELLAASALVYAALFTLGGLLDGRRWAVPAEIARLAATASAAAAVASGPLRVGALAACAAVAIALAVWLLLASARERGAAGARAAV